MPLTECQETKSTAENTKKPAKKLCTLHEMYTSNKNQLMKEINEQSNFSKPTVGHLYPKSIKHKWMLPVVWAKQVELNHRK